jgi:dienelactone hydrolase
MYRVPNRRSKSTVATMSKTSFELTGVDGGPLRGEVRTAGGGVDRPAVIICHGFKGFKDWGFFPHLAVRLANAGMTVVTFNFSGSGVGPDGESFSEPERFRRATISNDLTDVRIVSDALMMGGLVAGLAVPRALGALGHSRGGAVALLFAARRPECQALVTWSAIASFLRWDEATVARWRATGRMDITNVRTGDVLPLFSGYLDDLDADSEGELNLMRAAADLAIPWLVVHGDADESVSLDDAHELVNAAASDTATLAVVKDGSHTLGARHPWAGSTPQLDEGMDRTVEWFARYLL